MIDSGNVFHMVVDPNDILIPQNYDCDFDIAIIGISEKNNT